MAITPQNPIMSTLIMDVLVMGTLIMEPHHRHLPAEQRNQMATCLIVRQWLSCRENHEAPKFGFS